MGLLNLHELSGLGQTGQCGPAPGLGPGEKKMCCPDIGWVIYDQYENEYALCERAAGTGGSAAPPPSAPSSSAGDYIAQAEARRRAADAELDARRRELEERRMELEERQFQRELAATMVRAQLQKAQAKKAAEAAKISAKRQHELNVIQAREDAIKAERTRKAVTYGALALAAAKLLAIF
jgi:hypothetical protein